MSLWSSIKSWFVKPKPSDGAAAGLAGQQPRASLVFLCDRPVVLSTELFREIVEEQFGITLSEGDTTSDFIAGDGGSFFLRFGGRLFHVINQPTPYFADPTIAATSVNEPRLSHAVVRHRAWIAVDLLFEFPDATPDNAYAVLARLLASLALERALALYWPGGPGLWLCDERVAGALEAHDPLAVLRDTPPAPVPVFVVPNEDPRMHRAVEEARRCWPDFVAAFERREAGQSFSVKARFAEGEKAEFMWMKVTAIEANVIYGTLENEPLNLTRYRLGQRLRVAVSELTDWQYTESGESYGGFTDRVIRQIQRDQSGERPHSA